MRLDTLHHPARPSPINKTRSALKRFNDARSDDPLVLNPPVLNPPVVGSPVVGSPVVGSPVVGSRLCRRSRLDLDGDPEPGGSAKTGHPARSGDGNVSGHTDRSRAVIRYEDARRAPWRFCLARGMAPILALLLVTIVTASIGTTPATAQNIRYVDADAQGADDGTSWTDAYTSLQDALDEANLIGGVDEIWIAEGRYVPGPSRTSTFAIGGSNAVAGLRVVGGFQGGEASPSDRPLNFQVTAPTVLDGDYDNDSPTAIGDLTAVYDVVTVNSLATLDGVIVTGGNDDRAVDAIDSDGVSGGVLISGPDADGSTVINCVLRDNDGTALQGGSISGFNAGYSLINSLVTETGGGATLQDIVAATGARQGLTLNPSDLPGGVQTVTMENVTIAGNPGTVFAEAQVNAPVELVVDNSFIAENGEAAGGDPAESPAPGTSLIVEGDAVITNSVVEDAFVTECPTLASCVNVVEVLSAASGGSGDEALLSDDGFYTLQGSSPGLDAGDPSLLPNDATDLDGDGDTAEALPFDAGLRARIEGSTLDAGWTESTAPLPVELAEFEGRADGDAVVLTWTTLSESNNAGFHVEHRPASATPDRSVSWSRLTRAPIAGAGSTQEVTAYSYRTLALAPGPHSFRLRQVDVDGSETLTAPITVRVQGDLIDRFTLTGPNPFRSETSFQLEVAGSQNVVVEAFDILGRRVRTIYDGNVQPSAPVTVSLMGDGLAAGMYFIRASGETFRQTRKVVVLP